MKKEAAILQEWIGSVRPDLMPVHLHLVADGYHSTAYVVNNAYILRIPKTVKAIRSYLFEERVMPLLQERITMAVPRPVCYAQGGVTFSLHALIPGRSYADGCKEGDASDVLLKQIAAFVKELQEADITHKDIKFFDFVSGISEEKIKQAASYLKSDAIWREYADFCALAEKIEKKEKVLCHGDLNHSNLIVSPETGLLQGVIDFSDLCYQVSEYDFATLIKYDTENTLRLIEHYNQLTRRWINVSYVFLCARMYAYAAIAEMLVIGKNEKRIAQYQERLRHLDVYTHLWSE